MSATTLPGLTPGRQPYPGGAERHVPIVPHVLIVGERKGCYLPPPIVRAETVYDTPTTVRVKLPAGRQETQQQHKVWAIPDDAAWAEVEAAVGAFGQRLAELADVLRELGTYKSHLAKWAGAKTAPNPLCLTVARIDDPDTKNPTTWWLSAWHIPRLDRAPIERHTPKMLSSGGTGSYVFSQDNCFVLEDDAAWERVEAAHQAAEQAARDAQTLLERLGTYQDALDGRHAARAAPAERAVGAVGAPSSAAATVREQLGHALNWTGNGTPAYHLGEAREALAQLRAEAPGLALELEREVAAAAAQVAAREAGEKALAVVAPAVDGIVVMTVDEARRAADAIKVAVEDLRVKIDEFDQGQGWKALGYDSFRAWAQAEIPDTSIRHVYRLRDAAEVDRTLGVTIGHTPESHARELKGVAPEQRADVLKQADVRAQGAGRERTAADVRAAATSWLPDGWDEARERARAIGARLWHNASDGTYTLSERAGHVPRTSSWQELLMQLSLAEQRAAAVTNGHTSTTSDPLARVAELLRRGDTKAAYVAVREAAGDDYVGALAAVDARVEGRPLAQALAFLGADPADILDISTSVGPRKVLALRRAGPLALTLATLDGQGERAGRIEFRDGWFAVTHIPTGKAVGGVKIEGRPKADAIFEALAALDWSGVTTGLGMLLAEQAARIFGQNFPAAEAYEQASERARALELTLMRTTRNNVSGAPYYLLGPGGKQQRLDRWVDVLARLEAPAETPAAAAPLPPDYTEWVDRAHAAGCGLSRDDAGRFVLITPDGERETREGWISTIARIRGLEVDDPAPAPPEAEEPDAVPVDQRPQYALAERALVEELAACSPRLRRLLLCALSSPDDTPVDEGGDALFDLLTEGLLMTVDEALEWALAAEGATGGPAPRPAPVAAPTIDEEGDRWPHVDHPALEELSAELMGAELAGAPPDAGDLARWQATLDAHAADVSDETYERLAHRIGELRRRAREGVTA